MCKLLLKIACLFITAIFFASCATTTLVDTWRNPNLGGQRFHKLLVISVAKKGSATRIYGEVLVGELNNRGVDAVSGHEIFKIDGKVDRQILEKAVKESGAEAVLTLQTTKVEKQTIVQPGYVAPYPGYWSPSEFPLWDLYGYYGATTFYDPQYVTTYELATIMVSLFDGKSSKLLWAGTIQTSESGHVLTVAKELARIVLDSLVKNGFI